MRQAAVAVWATIVLGLMLVVMIQHRHDDPFAFAVVMACAAALAGWGLVRWLDASRR